jgi:hypothetical protein
MGNQARSWRPERNGELAIEKFGPTFNCLRNLVGPTRQSTATHGNDVGGHE